METKTAVKRVKKMTRINKLNDTTIVKVQPDNSTPVIISTTKGTIPQPYVFTVMGKKANIEFSIHPKNEVKDLPRFLTVNITKRLTQLFTLQYARNFAKSDTVEVTFQANGQILNTAKIAATIGLTLKAGKSQFEANESKVIPFEAKVSEIVQAGLMLMDTTDYSL